MTQLIEQYIDNLLRDPHAAPPQNMDAGTAAFVRAMVNAGHARPTAALRARVWKQALDAAMTGNGTQNHVVALPHSTNGHLATNGNGAYEHFESIPIRRSEYLPISARFRGVLTLAAAVALVLFGLVLLAMVGTSGTAPNASSGQQELGSTSSTETPPPVASGTPIPTPTTIPASAETQGVVEYTIRPGDTLFGILQSPPFNFADPRIVETIIALNPTLNLSALEVGTTILIPLPTPEPTPIATIPGTRLPSNLAAIMSELQSLTGNPDAGQSLFETVVCSACHDNASISTLAENIWQNAEDTIRRLPQFSSYTAEMYIVESIIHPSAYIVPGYANLMPDTYRENLTLQQLADLVAYLRAFALPQHSETATPIPATVAPPLSTLVEPLELTATFVPQTLGIEPVTPTATPIAFGAAGMGMSDDFICPPDWQDELPPLIDEQDVSVVIDSPVSGDAVSGEVSITGSVTHPWLWLYQLEYRLDTNQNMPWYGASGAGVEEVSNGVLGIWDSTTVPDGVYQLRLSVCLKDNTMMVTHIDDLRVENQQSGIGNVEHPANDPLVLTATHIVRQATNIAVRESTATAVAGRLTPTAVPPMVEPLALTATVIVREATATGVAGRLTPTAVPPEVTTYVIQEGDTLLEVALRFDTTLQMLAELNPQIDFSNCDFTRLSGGSNCTVLLMIGDTLIVPRYDQAEAAQPILATPTPIPFRNATATPIPTPTAA